MTIRKERTKRRSDTLKTKRLSLRMHREIIMGQKKLMESMNCTQQHLYTCLSMLLPYHDTKQCKNILNSVSKKAMSILDHGNIESGVAYDIRTGLWKIALKYKEEEKAAYIKTGIYQTYQDAFNAWHKIQKDKIDQNKINAVINKNGSENRTLEDYAGDMEDLGVMVKPEIIEKLNQIKDKDEFGMLHCDAESENKTNLSDILKKFEEA